MPRPRQAVRTELFDALDSALSETVVVQRQPKDSGSPLVMIEPPPVEARGDIKQETGHAFEQTIRVHTRYEKGEADVGKRDEVAQSVIDALNNATLDPTDHRIVHWPTEPTENTPQTYELGGEQAYDLILTYDIHTQIKATI